MIDNRVYFEYEQIQQLLLPERLDIIIKYLYIESYIANKNYSYYLDLYKRHIAFRTGGVEDSKRSISDYVRGFNNLIDSIKTDGFDINCPIPVSITNGIILNGAHRLACCLYFKVGCYVTYSDTKGISWDYDWMMKNGFSNDMVNVLHKYVELKHKNTFLAILWAPVESHWGEIIEIIKKNHKIVGVINYELSSLQLSSVIEDIYSFEFGVLTAPNIKEKTSILMKYKPKISLVAINIEAPKYIKDNSKDVCVQSLETKEVIRQIMKDQIDINKYVTVHTSDTPMHNIHISNVLLNTHSFEALKTRKNVEYRREFLEWLDEYDRVLRDIEVDKKDCCIVGSSTLEVFGIRKSTDVDFIMSSPQRERIFPDTCKNLSKNVDVVTKGYHLRANGDYEKYNDNQIIYDADKHIYFRGLKFADLRIIYDRKASEKRPKDLKDVILIDKFMVPYNKSNLLIKTSRFLNKVKIGFELYFVANFKHRVIKRIKHYIVMSLSDKQVETIRKILKK